MAFSLRNGFRSLERSIAPNAGAAGNGLLYPKSDGWYQKITPGNPLASWNPGDGIPSIIGLNVSINPSGYDGGEVIECAQTGDNASAASFAYSSTAPQSMQLSQAELPSAFPSTSAAILTSYDAAFSAQQARLILAGTGNPGQLRLLNSAGTQLTQTANSAVAVGQIIRFCLVNDKTNSRVRAVVWDYNTDALIWDTGWWANTYASNIGGCALGNSITTPTLGTIQFARLVCTDSLIFPDEQRVNSTPWAFNPVASGSYMQAQMGAPVNGGSYSPVNGSQIWIPFDIGPTSVTVDGIAANYATALTLGSATNPQLRLGIYNSSADGAKPTTVLRDGGIITATTLGGKSLGFSPNQVLTPGRYWLAAKWTITGSPTTLQTMAAFQAAFTSAGPTLGTMYYGWYQTGFSAGALVTMSGAAENIILPPNLGLTIP